MKNPDYAQNPRLGRMDGASLCKRLIATVDLKLAYHFDRSTARRRAEQSYGRCRVFVNDFRGSRQHCDALGNAGVGCSVWIQPRTELSG